MRIKKICPVCKKEFQAQYHKSWKQKYCSWNCYVKSCKNQRHTLKTKEKLSKKHIRLWKTKWKDRKAKTYNKKCPVCNKQFKYKLSYKRKYCSQKCYLEDIKIDTTKTCLYCYCKFEVTPNQYSRKYCSSKCKRKYVKENSEKYKLSLRGLQRCSKCKEIKKVNKITRLSQFYKDRSQNCGYSCACKDCDRIEDKEYRHKHPEKEQEAQRRYGRPNGGGVSKKVFGRIKEKHHWQCAICGKTEPFLGQYWIWLVQDHIVPKSKGGAKYSKNNIQPLCWDCNLKKSNKILS